jgi:hypothetical protein
MTPFQKLVKRTMADKEKVEKFKNSPIMQKLIDMKLVMRLEDINKQ